MKALTTALLTTTMLGGLAAPAVAASSSAEPTYYYGCTVMADGSKHCASVRFLSKTTQSASGNSVSLQRGASTVTVTAADGTRFVTTTSKAHTTTILKDGEAQVVSFRVRNNYSFARYDCSFTLKAQVVDGRVIFSDETYTCP